MRLVMAEMVLEIDLEAYEEKKLQTVSDVYSLKRQLVPVYQEQRCAGYAFAIRQSVS